VQWGGSRETQDSSVISSLCTLTHTDTHSHTISADSRVGAGEEGNIKLISAFVESIKTEKWKTTSAMWMCV